MVDFAIVEFVKGGVAVAAEEGGGGPVGAVDALEVGGCERCVCDWQGEGEGGGGSWGEEGEE